MNPVPRTPGPSLLVRLAPAVRFLASAAAAAYGIHLVMAGHAALGTLFFALTLLVLVVPLLAERSYRRSVYRSGNMQQILSVAMTEEVSESSDAVIPLRRALALAALGVTGPARLSLQNFRKRPRSDEEHEDLLVVEALVEAFEGEHTNASRRAAALDLLPLPESLSLSRRSKAVRDCVRAIVRAFDGRSDENDLALLLRGAEVRPMLHWATRYAAAAHCARRGAGDAVVRLIQGAPEWPEESAFHLLHRDLCFTAPPEQVAPERRVA